MKLLLSSLIIFYLILPSFTVFIELYRLSSSISLGSIRFLLVSFASFFFRVLAELRYLRSAIGSARCWNEKRAPCPVLIAGAISDASAAKKNKKKAGDPGKPKRVVKITTPKNKKETKRSPPLPKKKLNKKKKPARPPQQQRQQNGTHLNPMGPLIYGSCSQ